MTGTNIEFEVSSGNVFADLGLADADDLAYKAGLVGSIMRYQQEFGLRFEMRHRCRLDDDRNLARVATRWRS